MSFNNTVIYISRKLRLSGSSGEGRSAGAVIAVAGIAIALAVMEITLAVVSGFKSEIAHKIMGFDAQITVNRPFDYSTGRQADYITLTPDLKSLIEKSADNDANVALCVQLPAMIKTEDDFAGLIFTGYDSNHDFSFERNNLTDGVLPEDELPDGRFPVAISGKTASDLGLNVNDELFAYFFIDNSLKSRKLKVCGIYTSNLGEYDKTIAYAPIGQMQKVMGVDSVSGSKIEITGVADISDIQDIGANLQNLLNIYNPDEDKAEYYPVTTVLQTGAIYFNWLSLLDTNVVVIFIIMSCVALFTLVSSLYLIILDRIPTIGLLKALGMSMRRISALFVSMGMRLTIIGMVFGNIIGIAVCLLQEKTAFVRLDPAMYYLDKVPVSINPLTIIILNIAALAVAWLVLFVPSRSAAKIDATSTMNFK